MSNEETAQELAKLREDVAALSKVRSESTAPVESQPTAPEDVGIAAQLPADQHSQLEELGSLLQEEIKDLPTITCLAVFSLGILMGRLMR